MPFHFFYRDGNSSGNTKRVWRSDWGGDMFETLSIQEFEELRCLCARFSIQLKEAED